MMSSFDDQNQIPPFADGFSTERALSSRQTVTSLAAEVLLQVARRANAARRARDTAEIAAVSAALTTASEDEATAALQALDDPNRPHDWFLTERLGVRLDASRYEGDDSEADVFTIGGVVKF